MDRFQTLWRSRVQAIQTIFTVGITTLGLWSADDQWTYGQVISAQDSIQTQVIQSGSPSDPDYLVVGGTLSTDASFLFHSFEQFDVGRGQIAEFRVAPGVNSVLSRIVNGDPSHIHGMLEVSGGPANLYLINPAGLLFGPGASINLAGDFTALTANRLDFTQGNFTLVDHPGGVQGSILQLNFSPHDPATIVNLGDLRVGAEHSLSLIGHTVVNLGTISGGAINLAAVGDHGDVMVANGLQFGPSQPPSQPDQPLPPSLPPWLTPGGTEHAAAIELAEDGSFRLTGSPLSSPLSFFEDLPLGTLLVGGKLTTPGYPANSSPSHLNRIQLLGDHVATMAATLQAVDGGRILVGGDYQGGGSLPTAQSTFIDAATTLVADGNEGGQVVVWSDGLTQFRGAISAQGVVSGGSVEISGKEQLYFGGQVDLRSQGTPGMLLLDPENIEIRAGSDPGHVDNSEPYVLYEDTLESSIIGNAHLVLRADNDITLNPLSDGALTLPQEMLSISFVADADGDGQGSFTMSLDNRLELPTQDLSITAADITVGDINTRAFSLIDNGRSAGEIQLTATHGSINGGDFTSTAGAGLNNHGDGGNIVLSAADTITIGSVTTTTDAISNMGQAGNIILQTQMGAMTTGALDSSTFGDSNNMGGGGGIRLSAMGRISTGDITTSARANINNSGTAGNVALTSQMDNLTLGLIAADGQANGSNTGNGGNISLAATQGTILTQAISATAISPDLAETQGGDIQVNAHDIVVDSINATATGQGGDIEMVSQRSIRVVDTIADSAIAASLLTTDGGTIRLTYNREPTVPFSLENSDEHGTAGSISTGVETLRVPAAVEQSISLDTIELNNLYEPPAAPQPPELPSPELPSPELPSPELPSPELPPQSPAGPPQDIVPPLDPRNSFDIDEKTGEPGDVGERGINYDELIWAQIETAFSSEFAQALNLPMPASPSLQATQQALSQVSHTQNISPALMYIRLKENHIELVLVGADGLLVYRPVAVTAAEVQAVMDTFQQTITDPVLRPAQYLPAAQQLFDWFVRPMLDDLEMANIDHIGFILDRGLRSIPMAALHDGQRFLIEDYSIGLLPSVGLTSLEPSSTIESAKAMASGADALGIADPGATLAMGIADFDQQADLEAVPLELELASRRQNDEYYLDHEFTLEALTQRLEEGNFSSVHLATHAIFHPGDLESSYVQFWDQTVNLSQLQELPLDAIDFLILSACATALGNHDAEFGFAGLAVNVGVQTALASLWSISDEGTLGLMSEFYRAMEQPLGRSTALRQAQLAMIQGKVGIRNGTVYGAGDRIIGHLPGLDASGSWDFSHPAYWSGFTMIGNPW